MSKAGTALTIVLLYWCLIMQTLSLRFGNHVRRRSTNFWRTYPLSAAASYRDQVTVRNSLIITDGNGPTYTKLDISKPLSWYSCGPTVYDSSHLGHARTYVCTDIIRRIMMNYLNVNLNYAMGITDIDDKIIDKGRSVQLRTWPEMQQMVRGLEDDFFYDMDRLNVLRPDTVLRVTEHIPEIISYISRLVELKNAYVAADGVYFDFSSLTNTYDKFGCAHPGSSEADVAAVDNDSGTPIDPNIDNSAYQASTKHHKRNAKDFALWKLHRGSPDGKENNNNTGAQQACTWDSPWGPGRPGWHIECSAMTHSLFGPHIDIHSGGVDLKFPHHTNEIAQCESHNCAEHNGWVGSWIHLGHLHIEGRKMSKSLKNFISIDDYLRGGQTSHPGDDFRIYCLLHKYHSSLTYAPVRIQEAAKFRQKMEGFSSSVRAAIALYSNSKRDSLTPAATAAGSSAVSISRKPTVESAKLSALLRTIQDDVHTAMCDDFDTPKVLHCLSQLVGESTLYVQLLMAEPVATENSCALMRPQPIEPLLSVSAYITRILSILGLRFPAALASQQHLCTGDGMVSADGGTYTPSSGATTLSDDTIDAIVAFRSQVRTAALQGTKALKAQKKVVGSLTPVESQLEASLAQIMASCDAGREALGKALAVKIDDMGSASKWTKV